MSSPKDVTHDVCVIGAGLVGLATAHALVKAAPDVRLVVLDKEDAVARHQSGHNSNVIHSGVFYEPGSLKARMARRGGQELGRYCAERSIPVRTLGKLVVSGSAAPEPRFEVLAKRAEALGVQATILGPAEVRDREPLVRPASALLLPSVAITDYQAVARALAADITEAGAAVRLGAGVETLARRGTSTVIGISGGDEVRARMIVNCAGLHSDRIARLAGATPTIRIVPFRGEYADIADVVSRSITSLVYPLPDPTLPFLGVHVTPSLHGLAHAGPNAVLALDREGYRWRDLDGPTIRALAVDPALRALARRYWRVGAAEVLRSAFWPLFVRSVRNLLPGVEARHLRRAGSGVRAQAVTDDGRLVDDFVIENTPGAVHVLNAPSPAATACLSIGRHVARHVLDQLDVNGAVIAAPTR